jgi:mannose-1-phosphate guanylyltransferase
MNSHNGATWALVLAAGEGNRLRALTTTSSGIAVPKQFCSLRGGPSLLHEALQRAESVVPKERICTIVAQQHRHWWDEPLSSLDPRNVIVQPSNRGTAIGILLPLLHIADRDPQANVILLPSDHHVRDESILAIALQRAVDKLATNPGDLVLLGVAPEEADPELGYIVPANDEHIALSFEVQNVRQFVAKPALDHALDLILRGALWNVFIFAARAAALLKVFESRCPEVVMLMREIVSRDRHRPIAATAAMDLYRYLPELDFSRGIAQGNESTLKVLRVPKCGWSDLGTPKRVAETLRNSSARRSSVRRSAFQSSGHLSLAEQHAALATG